MSIDDLQIDNRQAAQVTVIVSPGRTVVTGNPTKTVEIETGLGKRWAKVPVMPAEKTEFYEGEEVQLPAAEARRLAALGFVYFPDAAPGFSRPLGRHRVGAEPLVERVSPDGPTTMQPGDDPDDADLGKPIGMTQAEPPRARPKG